MGRLQDSPDGRVFVIVPHGFATSRGNGSSCSLARARESCALMPATTRSTVSARSNACILLSRNFQRLSSRGSRSSEADLRRSPALPAPGVLFPAPLFGCSARHRTAGLPAHMSGTG